MNPALTRREKQAKLVAAFTAGVNVIPIMKDMFPFASDDEVEDEGSGVDGDEHDTEAPRCVDCYVVLEDDAKKQGYERCVTCELLETLAMEKEARRRQEALRERIERNAAVSETGDVTVTPVGKRRRLKGLRKFFEKDH